MARSANSRRGRTGVSSKAGGTHHDRPRERRPQMPHLTFIKEDSVSLPATKMVATSLLGYREVGDIRASLAQMVFDQKFRLRLRLYGALACLL